MKVSILVPFKSFGDSDRDLNWSWIRARFESLHPEWEICVGESEQPFNRGMAINDAASKATGDLFYISDADCFVYPEQAIEAVRLASEAPGAVIAGARWLALERSITWQIRIGQHDIRFASEPPAWCEVVGTVSGCMAISRESFEATKGYPRGFDGWGFEDNCFWYAQETLVAHGRRLEGDLYHLWHPSARDPETDAYKRNEIRNELFGAAYGKPDEMRALIG
jgi:Glycosyl transferase family 2.